MPNDQPVLLGTFSFDDEYADAWAEKNRLEGRLSLFNHWLERELLGLKAKYTPLDEVEQQSLREHQARSELQDRYKNPTPILDQLELLHKVDFFHRLSSKTFDSLTRRQQRRKLTDPEQKTLKEHQALAEFNAIYKQTLLDDITQKAQKNHITPEQLKHYLRIRIEGEDYPAQQLSRWQRQFPSFQARDSLFRAPANSRKLRAVMPLDLPQSINDLPVNGLIRLAFASKGRYFYHYLNQHINDAIQQRANCSDQPLNDFYDHLNRLDQQTLSEMLQKNHTHRPLLYAKMVDNTHNPDIDLETNLACTDGKPLDYLASQYVLSILDSSKKEEHQRQNSSEKFVLSACSWTEVELKLLSFAAHYGSFEAAKTLTNLAIKQIEQGQSLKEILQPYLDYVETSFPSILNRYKAAGALLLVSMQRFLVLALTEKLTGYISKDQCINTVQKHICYTLTLAQAYEETHKNALRLSLNSDDCRKLVETLYEQTHKRPSRTLPLQLVHPSQTSYDTPLTIVTTDDAFTHLNQTNQHLREEFSRIRSYSPKSNRFRSSPGLYKGF